MLNPILRTWHRTLRLTRQPSASWHRARIAEELKERRVARNQLEKLSETSDVLFSISRARHDGFAIRLRPSVFSHPLAYGHMLAKFTSWWGFYRAAASLSGAQWPRNVREVVSPAREAKLDEVAARHGIDAVRFNAVRFRKISRRMLRIWPLLP
ncbi:uncharacterized protein DSM5745_06532 [Aspergillus mulundensis]|uniref:Uncharacterized protein n=1 Tax=Aspergillus mulundensis TaxID=1810919 RepID=A0A3D8RRE8_9EURO|nr:hypothetical protein DSM5745_06532 [Aspergillus mulundensis]RDW76540.1 hypothetical protein DSM5745_06532 [Aspergillus mulundensis]